MAGKLAQPRHASIESLNHTSTMAKTQTTATPENFESAVAELEALVAAMERDDLPLEEALSHYQRGLALLKHCQTTLAAAEQRIQILEKDTLVDLNLNESSANRK